MKIRESAGIRPYLATYRSVMSLAPLAGLGRKPRMLKCRVDDFPGLHGAAPHTTVYWAGALGTLSLRVITPPSFVAKRSPTGLMPSCGSGGGVTNWSGPSAARVQLIFRKNWKPVGGADRPSRCRVSAS